MPPRKKKGPSILKPVVARDLAALDEMLDTADDDLDIEEQDGGGFSALHLAANNGDVEIAKVLLEVGCKVNAANTYMQSALHAACRHGHLDMCKLLCDNGVTISRDSSIDNLCVLPLLLVLPPVLLLPLLLLPLFGAAEGRRRRRRCSCCCSRRLTPLLPLSFVGTASPTGAAPPPSTLPTSSATPSALRCSRPSWPGATSKRAIG